MNTKLETLLEYAKIYKTINHRFSIKMRIGIWSVMDYDFRLGPTADFSIAINIIKKAYKKQDNVVLEFENFKPKDCRNWYYKAYNPENIEKFKVAFEEILYTTTSMDTFNLLHNLNKLKSL